MFSIARDRDADFDSDKVYKNNIVEISNTDANKQINMPAGYGISLEVETETNNLSVRYLKCNFTKMVSNVNYIFNIESMVSNTNYTYNDFCLLSAKDRELNYPYGTFYALTNEVYFIGDKTNKYITIPEGNTDILQYTLGEGINRQFVPKTLQINAPCEYGDVEFFLGYVVNENIDLNK